MNILSGTEIKWEWSELKKKWTFLVFRKMISANKRTMGIHYYDFNLMQTKVNKNNANCNSNYKIIEINNTMYFQLFFKEKYITKNYMYINVSLLSIYIYIKFKLTKLYLVQTNYNRKLK